MQFMIRVYIYGRVDYIYTENYMAAVMVAEALLKVKPYHIQVWSGNDLKREDNAP